MYRRSIIWLAGLLIIFAFTIIPKKPQLYQFPKLPAFPQMPVSEVNPVTEEGADLGRWLFYDSILSIDRTISCASCHKQEYAFADKTQFSTGINGHQNRRNTLPLFNLAWYPAMFWDGRAPTIEDQIFHPVRDHDEMGMTWIEATQRVKKSPFYRSRFKNAFPGEKIDSVNIARAIAQFLRTLISHNSKYDRVLRGEAYFTEEEYQGFILINDMTKGDCLHCHTTDADALGTIAVFSNNGLDHVENPLKYSDKGFGDVTGNLADNGKFKIPSLRNIALTAPYMHDGRFNTLEEVLDFYSEGVQATVNIDSKMGLAHQGGVQLTCKEREQIIAFLHTLTDSVFVTNSQFSNPFR